MKSSCLLTLMAIFAVFLLSTPVAAGPINPVYNITFSDAVTGDNSFIANDGKRYWTIDPGADSYQTEVYERPTVQNYQVHTSGGSEHFATPEYYENLDIISAKAGFDSEYLYFAIEMFGRNRSTSDGVNTPEGLIYEYGVRFSTDPDGRFGYLLRAIQPEEHGTTFGLEKNLGFFDEDGDVGGRGLINGVGPSGLSVTKEDNPFEEVGMNGYSPGVISDGRISDGPDKDTSVLYSRIDPLNDRIVEIAFGYDAFGLDEPGFPQIIEYLDFQAIKGDPMDPQNYFWNDKYTKNEAGSPYRATSGDLNESEFGTQGLGNIYELDTLRGGTVIPEPSSLALLFTGFTSILGCGLWKKRKS